MTEINEIVIKLDDNKKHYIMKVQYIDNEVQELLVPLAKRHTLEFNQKYHRMSDNCNLGYLENKLVGSIDNVTNITYEISLTSSKGENGELYSVSLNQEYIEEQKKKKIKNKLNQIESLKKEIETIISEEWDTNKNKVVSNKV